MPISYVPILGMFIIASSVYLCIKYNSKQVYIWSAMIDIVVLILWAYFRF